MLDGEATDDPDGRACRREEEAADQSRQQSRVQPAPSNRQRFVEPFDQIPVELDVPVVSTQASHLSVLPKFKAELRDMEFKAAAEAGVTTFASIFHGCHRELIKYQPQVTFETLNFMELIGEGMGIHIPDLYKRLRMLGDMVDHVAEEHDLEAP